MFFYALYCDIISLTSLKITQAFHLLLGCAKNLTAFRDFYIHNSVQITKGSGNGGSDKRGSTALHYKKLNNGHARRVSAN